MNNNKGFINILVAVIIVVVIGVVGYFAITKKSEAPNQSNPQITYQTKEECEQQSGESCDFVMCDVAAPGKTIEETCGSVGKGWMPVFPEEENSETANWQTYQDKEYGFELKYPSLLKFTRDVIVSYNHNKEERIFKKGVEIPTSFKSVVSASLNEPSLISSFGLVDTKSDNQFLQIFRIKKSETFTNLKSYLEVEIKNNEENVNKYSSAPINISLENFKLGDSNTFQLIYSKAVTTEPKDISIYLELKDELLIFRYSYSGALIKPLVNVRGEELAQVEYSQLILNTIQKILQTFKFTNKNNDTSYSKILFGTQEITDKDEYSFKFKTPITVTVISPNAKKVDILTGPTGTGVAGLEKVRLSDSNPKDGFIFDIPNCKILGYDGENVPPRIYINIEYLNGQNSSRMLTFPYCLNS
jgi:hypothetical protein